MELANNKNNIPKINKTESKIFIPSDDKSDYMFILRSMYQDLTGVAITTTSIGDHIDMHFEHKMPVPYNEFPLGSSTRNILVKLYSTHMNNRKN